MQAFGMGGENGFLFDVPWTLIECNFFQVILYVR